MNKILIIQNDCGQVSRITWSLTMRYWRERSTLWDLLPLLFLGIRKVSGNEIDIWCIPHMRIEYSIHHNNYHIKSGLISSSFGIHRNKRLYWNVPRQIVRSN